METNNYPILLVFLSAYSRVAKLRSTRMCKCRSKQDAGCDRSLLCSSCYTTEDKQKSCPIMDDYSFPAPLAYTDRVLYNMTALNSLEDVEF